MNTFIKKVLLMTLFTIIMFYPVIPLFAQTPQDIAKIARMSCVKLVMDNNQYGSGFFITRDHVVTAYHVIEGAKSGYVLPVMQKEKFEISSIIAQDKENDIVILKIYDTIGTPLSISDSNIVNVMDDVIVVGNPAEKDGTVSPGVITNIMPGRKYFMTNAPVSGGSSGGAVLDNKGTVIGLIIGSYDEDKNQNLNVITPSNYLLHLIDEHKNSKVSKPLSTDGINNHSLTWNENSYDLSFNNQTRNDIQSMRCLVLFYDENDRIICLDQINLFKRSILYAGSTQRIRRNSLSILFNPAIDGDFSKKMVDMLDDRWTNFNPQIIKPLVKRYEVKIIDLNIVGYASNNYISSKSVTGGNLIWSNEYEAIDNTSFTFSINNLLKKDVKQVSGRIIFYNYKRIPIHTIHFNLNYVGFNIPAGETITINEDVIYDSIRHLTKSIEIQIHSFQIIE